MTTIPGIMGYLTGAATAIDTTIGFGSLQSSGNNAGLGIVFVYSGIDSVTPLDVTSTTATGIDSRHPNPPSITPVTSGAVIVAAGVGSAGVSAQACSNMPAMLSQTFSGNSWTGQGGMAHKTDWTSGAFDPAVWTGGSDNNSDAWCAATVALRPLAGSLTFVGAKMESYAGQPTHTMALNTGLSFGTRDHVEAGDFVLAALLCANGTGGDFDVVIDTAGYTEICDLNRQDVRGCNMGMFWKIMGT